MISGKTLLLYLRSKIPGDTTGHWADKVIKFQRTRSLISSFLFIALVAIDQLTGYVLKRTETSKIQNSHGLDLSSATILTRYIYFGVILVWLLVCIIALKFERLAQVVPFLYSISNVIILS